MAETAVEIKNDVQITDVGPSRKKLSITIPPEAVEAKIVDSIDTIAVEADMPGFRRGHAPRALVEKKFGEAVRKEAKNQLIAQAYTQAVEDNSLKVLGDPIGDLGETLKLEKGKPLSFEVEVEVMPVFDLPTLDGLTIDKPIVEVTGDMVTSELEKVRINEGTLETPDHPAQDDYLTGHAIMRDADNNEHYNIQGAVIQIPTGDNAPKGMILGLIVDDLGEQIGIPSAGDDLTVKTTGPDQHEIEGVRGADLTITFKVDRVDRIIPATIEELLQRSGLAEQKDLEDAIRTRMEQRVQLEQLSVMHQQVAKHLLDNVEMDLPERLTTQQAGRLLDRKRMELMHRGLEPREVEEHIAQLRAASAEAAGHELKLFFVLNAVADKLEIFVSEAEVNGRIAQIARSRQTRPEALRQELIQTNRIGTIVQQIREHKAMGAVLAKAEITELQPDAFNKKHAKKGS